MFKELEIPESSEPHMFPIYEPLQRKYTRYPPPDISGKGKLPKTHNFHLESHREWNIDNLSVGQIRQMIDLMFTEYKIMCLKGKNKVEACKYIIQCFTGRLLRWWEIET